MIVLGIDPGERESGVVLYDTDARRVLGSQFPPNIKLAHLIHAGYMFVDNTVPAIKFARIICEKPAAMGQPLSGNLVETIIWCGIFWWAAELSRLSWTWITRNQVKVAICGKCQGVKDAHVLTGVQERFGGRDAAKGNKKSPGPCYGVSGHAWQALAAVIAAIDVEITQ